MVNNAWMGSASRPDKITGADRSRKKWGQQAEYFIGRNYLGKKAITKIQGDNAS